jgi:outer membrane lipoprotein-sorting protein
MTIKQAVACGLLAMTPALTGCLVHTRSVLKTRLPELVYSSTLDQLLKQVDDRNAAIQSMTLYVRMSTSSGGSLQGQVKETISFNGFIIIGKPEQIRVLLQLPLTLGGSKILDMVSDGKTFKMLIPPKNCAITGSDVVTNNSQKGLYSLRPAVILDSLLINGLQPDQVVSMTQDSWIPQQPKSRKGVVEDPDYDIQFLSQPQGKNAHTLRVVHIDRINLLPWRQDIYDIDGKVATQAFYSNYQKFGDINFPTKIVIQRPLDELGLTITITKGTTFNQPLPEEPFKLDIPDTIAHLTNMDDPASATIKDPCAAHAPQSQR